VQNTLILITELTLCVPIPTSSDHIVFSSYGIMPDKPKPNLNLKRNFCLPQVSEGSIHTIAANIFVDRFNSELAIFRPLPNGTQFQIQP
jgi:hypothetical protein